MAPNRNIQKKSYEKKKVRNYGNSAPIAPKRTDADPKKDVLGATGDQGYINKLFGSLSKDDQDLNEPQLDQKELDLLDDAARIKHLYLHQKAVDAYNEEKARKKNAAMSLLQKEDKYGSMTCEEIVKEDPLAITTFRPSRTIKSANGLGVYSVVWSKSGRLLASTGHDRSVALWRPETGNLARKLKGHKGWTLQCCFSPDDKMICCCSSDEMYIWEIENGVLKAKWEAHVAMINGCHWSSNGKFLLSTSNDMTAKVWNVKQCLSKGKIAARGGKKNPGEEEDDEEGGKEKLRPVFDLPKEGERGHSAAVVKGEISPDGDYVVTCGKDNFIFLWNLKLNGAVDRQYKGHSDQVLNVHWNYDGSRIASCDHKGFVFIWDPKVENPVHILKEHTDIVYDCIWGRESKEGRGRLFTCGHDCKLLTWNSYDGVVIGEHVGKHEQWITGISIDHSNLKLATCSMDANSSVVIWTSLPPVPKFVEWVEKVVKIFKKIRQVIKGGR